MRLIILFCCVLIHAAIFSQQNFINVPSTEVTSKNKIFFQQQININELVQSNTTLDFGLGKGFEAGVNVLGLNFNEKTKSFFNNDTNDVDPYNPLVTINGLKYFEITNKVSIGVGGQTGANFRVNHPTYPASLAYANLKLENLLGQNSNCVFGAYYNSRHYGGKGNRFGVWAGAEIPVKQNFHIMAESVLGDNSICYSSLGVIYYPRPRLPITLGLQIPNTKKNSYSLVFELTFVP